MVLWVLVSAPADGHFIIFLEATTALFFHICSRWLPALFALFPCKISFTAFEVASDVLLFSFDMFESKESSFFEFAAESTWLPPSSREKLRGLSVR